MLFFSLYFALILETTKFSRVDKKCQKCLSYHSIYLIDLRKSMKKSMTSFFLYYEIIYSAFLPQFVLNDKVVSHFLSERLYEKSKSIFCSMK